MSTPAGSAAQLPTELAARRGQRRHPGRLPPAVPRLVVPRPPLCWCWPSSHLLAWVCAAGGCRWPSPSSSRRVGAACSCAAGCSTPPPPRLGLPTRDHVRRLHRRPARGRRRCFRDVEAPAEALPGFVAGTAIALWIDRLPGRLGGVPAVGALRGDAARRRGLFVFASLFGADQYRAGAAALCSWPRSLVFLLLHRAWRLESSAAWMRGDAQRGSRALVRAGVSLAAAALVAGAATGPLLPGATPTPSSTGRTSAAATAPGSRSARWSTSSPAWSAVRDRGVHRPLRPAGLLAADVARQPSTAACGVEPPLRQVDGELPAQTAARRRDGRGAAAASTSAASSQIWLPAAYEPREIDAAEVATRWEPTTSTLIVDARPPTASVHGRRPRPRTSTQAGDLRQATGAPPDTSPGQFLELPADFSPRVASLAEQVTSRRDHPLRARRSPCRSFFRAELRPTRPTSPRARRQPARVVPVREADGLLRAVRRRLRRHGPLASACRPGSRSASRPATSDAADPTLYHVKGKHAHAWPEVYLTGYGWVLFEPTPSRGAPNAELHRRDGGAGPRPRRSRARQRRRHHHGARLQRTPSTPTPVRTDPGGAAPVEPLAEPPPELARRGTGWAGWLLFVLLGVAALYVVAVLGGRAAAPTAPAPAGSHGPRPHRRRLAGGGRLARRPRHRGEPGGDAAASSPRAPIQRQPGRSGAAPPGRHSRPSRATRADHDDRRRRGQARPRRDGGRRTRSRPRPPRPSASATTSRPGRGCAGPATDRGPRRTLSSLAPPRRTEGASVAGPTSSRRRRWAGRDWSGGQTARAGRVAGVSSPGGSAA